MQGLVSFSACISHTCSHNETLSVMLTPNAAIGQGSAGRHISTAHLQGLPTARRAWLPGRTMRRRRTLVRWWLLSASWSVNSAPCHAIWKAAACRSGLQLVAVDLHLGNFCSPGDCCRSQVS